jgi:hypothetical protein
MIGNSVAGPDLFCVEDENAVIAERDFLGLPERFVATVCSLKKSESKAENLTISTVFLDSVPPY